MKWNTIDRKVGKYERAKERSSHNNTSGGVLVAEGGGVADFGGAGTCEMGIVRIIGVSHVTGGGFLIVHPGCVGVRNDVVGDVWPELCFLAGAVSYAGHHLRGLHVAHHRDFVGLPIHIHLVHAFHPLHRFPHFPLTPFAVHLHFHLHRLIHSFTQKHHTNNNI